MSKQISSVEFLVKEINQIIGFIPINKWDEIRGVIQQAKAMHKQEIEDAFKHGKLPPLFVNLTAKDYYNQTFEK